MAINILRIKSSSTEHTRKNYLVRLLLSLIIESDNTYFPIAKRNTMTTKKALQDNSIEPLEPIVLSHKVECFKPIKNKGKNYNQELDISCSVMSEDDIDLLDYKDFSITLSIDGKVVGDISHLLSKATPEAYRMYIDGPNWMSLFQEQKSTKQYI